MTQPSNFLNYSAGHTTKVYDLTATQLNHLNTAPVIIIPPPGAGKIIIPNFSIWQYTFGSVAYTLDGPVFYLGDPLTTGTQIAALSSPATLVNGADSGMAFQVVSAWAVTNASAVNQAFFLFDDLNSTTTGNGTVRLSVVYNVYTLV